MGAPIGNCNAAKNQAACLATKGRRRYPKKAKGIYGELVNIFEITGHTARTDKGLYHTSKLFNRSGKALWRTRGY